MKRFLLLTALLMIAAAQSQAASIAYMSGANEPWAYLLRGDSSNLDAMNAAFGAGNWDRIQFGAAFDDYDTLYVDGGAQNSDAFFTWSASNLPALQNFVIGGGELFLNAAGWSYDGVHTLLFNSSLTESQFSNVGNAVDPTHSIFADAGTSWWATYFSHDTVAGQGLTTFITGTTGAAILAGGQFGAGYYLLGGQTNTSFHTGVTASPISASRQRTDLRGCSGWPSGRRARAGNSDSSEFGPGRSGLRPPPPGLGILFAVPKRRHRSPF